MPWSLLISAAALILTIITAVWKLSSVITRNTSEYISKIVKEVISFYSKHYAEVMYMHDAYKK